MKTKRQLKKDFEKKLERKSLSKEISKEKLAIRLGKRKGLINNLNGEEVKAKLTKACLSKAQKSILIH